MDVLGSWNVVEEERINKINENRLYQVINPRKRMKK